MWHSKCYNTLRPRRNEQHFADDIFKCIFFSENVWISIKSSLKFVPKGPINNIPALVQIMAWCRSGDKPLSEPMMVGLPTHICVTRPQWVNHCMALKFITQVTFLYWDYISNPFEQWLETFVSIGMATEWYGMYERIFRIYCQIDFLLTCWNVQDI